MYRLSDEKENTGFFSGGNQPFHRHVLKIIYSVGKPHSFNIGVKSGFLII